jgi:prevent-host-death family protein
VTVIAHRDLRNRSSEILRDVANGETFEITNHGDVVAVLCPANSPPGVRLRVRPAHRPRAFSILPRTRLDHPVLESLNELRGEA